MDISLTLNPSKRAYSVQTQTVSQQNVKKPAAAQTDRLSLSQQAVAYLEENDRRIQEQMRRTSTQNSDGSVASDGGASDILDTFGEAMKEMEKCNKIAASIMKGKRVPLEDMLYLLEHDGKAYQMAMAMRKPEKDNKEEKSVLDDEDRNGDTELRTTSEEVVSATCEVFGDGEVSSEDSAYSE